MIGEAVSKLPAEIKETEPKIPWTLIKGMRNRHIHEYFGTDLSLVWNVIKNELPSFYAVLKQMEKSLVEQGK